MSLNAATFLGCMDKVFGLIMNPDMLLLYSLCLCGSFLGLLPVSIRLLVLRSLIAGVSLPLDGFEQI